MKRIIPIIALIVATPAYAQSPDRYEDMAGICRATMNGTAEEQLRRIRLRWRSESDVFENMTLCLGYSMARADIIKRIVDAVK